MDDKINLAAKFALLDQPYRPGVVGFVNDYKLQVVKVRGPFVRHKHDETDDFSSSSAAISRFTYATATSSWTRASCSSSHAESSTEPLLFRVFVVVGADSLAGR